MENIEIEKILESTKEEDKLIFAYAGLIAQLHTELCEAAGISVTMLIKQNQDLKALSSNQNAQLIQKIKTFRSIKF